MRKIFLFISFLITTTAVTQAQSAGDNSSTGSVTLILRLTPIQTLLVNPSQKSIVLEYTDASDYKNGVSSEQKDHLKIFSTGAFTINVHAASDDIKQEEGDETISAHTLKVKATAGSSNAMTNATVNEVNLSATAASLISSGMGGADKNFNVTYSGMGADAYVNKYYDSEKPTVYSTTVTYTIAAN